jgi:hypothetical protein
MTLVRLVSEGDVARFIRFECITNGCMSGERFIYLIHF